MHDSSVQHLHVLAFSSMHGTGGTGVSPYSPPCPPFSPVRRHLIRVVSPLGADSRPSSGPSINDSSILQFYTIQGNYIPNGATNLAVVYSQMQEYGKALKVSRRLQPRDPCVPSLCRALWVCVYVEWHPNDDSVIFLE